MSKEELKEILDKHKKWLNDKEGGEKANLSYANLRYVDLSCTDLRSANLRYVDLSCTDLTCADLRYADLRYANLRCANLTCADLRGADLRYADLRGAVLDYSCFPLWCGGKNWTVDKNLPNMLAAFICSMKCDDEKVKEMQEKLLEHAKLSHRYDDILG